MGVGVDGDVAVAEGVVVRVVGGEVVTDVVVEVDEAVDEAAAVEEIVDVVVVPPPELKTEQVPNKSSVFLKPSITLLAPLPTKTSNL